MKSLLQLPPHNSAILYDSVSPECLLQALITSPERAPQSMPHLDTLKDGVRLGLWMHGSQFNGKHWSGNVLKFELAHISSRAILLLNTLMQLTMCREIGGVLCSSLPYRPWSHTHTHTHVLTTWLCICDWFFFCAATYCTSKEIHHWQIGWENQIHGSLSSMRALREVVTFFTHIKVLRKQYRFKTSMGTEYQKYWLCSKMVPDSVSLVVLYQYNSCIHVHDAFWCYRFLGVASF